MGKKSNNTREVEPLFAPVATNDDEDLELAADGGPSTRFRDDPTQSSLHSPNNDKDGGPAIKYRDEPESNSSVFDWGDDNTNTPGNDNDNNNIGDVYQIDEEEFDTNATGFSPVSLHDSDSDDEENIGSGRKIRQKANNMLNQRVFDETTYNDDDDRIFVGGGWGRHGSQFSLCPNGSSWCCRRSTVTQPSYSRGPRVKMGYSTTQVVCGVLAFVALVFGGGFIGYEAGLPVEEEEGEDSTTVNKGENTQLFPKHTHTKGQEWLEWIEHEKDEIHMPHFNMTFHKSHLPKKDKGDETPHFDPMTQAELLALSEHVFQSCSERSLKTDVGRDACLSHCHGHYCCFEKEKEYGSCVAEPNSYCFAYAACENVITDFGMNNANTHSGYANFFMSEADTTLLEDTCSSENIATLQGMRDCTAFCQHHLCCFSTLESENCKSNHVEECTAYAACDILVQGPDVKDGSVSPEYKGTTEASESQTFKDSCSTMNKLQQNWDVCKNHCSRFACCFREGNGSCYDEEQQECDEYSICEEFFDVEEYGEDESSTSFIDKEQEDKNVELAVFNIICSSDTIEQNSKVCKEKCTPFACCFSRNSCYDQETQDCEDHMICEQYFYDEQQPSQVVENINNSINKSNNSNQVTNGGANKQDKPPTPNQGIIDAVQAVCNKNIPGDSWVTGCHALCSNYLCCFSTEGTESNCRDSYGNEVCDAYQGCKILHSTSTDSDGNVHEFDLGGPTPNVSSPTPPSPTPPPPQSPKPIISDPTKMNAAAKEEKDQSEVAAVEEACVPKARRDPWLIERCRKACDVRSCCFESGLGSCESMDAEYCDEFESCFDILYD